MYLPELPDEVQGEDVRRALESLGIPTARNTEAVFRADGIEVTYLRTNADGELLPGGRGRISKVTTSIKVRWSRDDD